MRDRGFGFRLPRGAAGAVAAEQFAANRSSRAHAETFASHRERLTTLLLESAAGGGRLCVLGAGNVNDLDLPRLLQTFTEVHLVDLDKAAIVAARARLPEPHRAHVHLHAPVDLSGLLARLSDWKERKLSPEALMQWPRTAVADIVARLGGEFDVVASTCVLTQLQLGVLQALGDHHPWFQLARHTVSVVHLRTLVQLLAPQGRALLATDVASDADGVLPSAASDDERLAWLAAPEFQARLFDTVDPRTLAQTFADDPMLARQATLSPPLAAWTWSHGPARAFLVYAACLRRTP